MTEPPVPQPGPQPGPSAATPLAPPTGAVARFDAIVDRAFDPLRGNPVADALFEGASHLGDWSLIWHIATTAIGLLPDEEPADTARVAVLLGFESLLVNQGIKRLFRRTRPHPDAEVAARLRTPRTSSFPSGHASAACTAAGLLGAAHPRLRVPLYTTAFVVATSRIHTRMHHPSDVVAGAAVGIALARAANRIWPPRTP